MTDKTKSETVAAAFNAFCKEHNIDTYIAAFTDSAGQEHQQFKPMPQVKMRKDAWVECMKLLDRLGLSPAARARMVIQKRIDEDNDLDES